MKLNEVRDNKGARSKSKRLGRGIGSGKGKTAGKGHKGQNARSGVAVKGFEGGQMPIYMRLPKRGFNNPLAKEYAEINLSDLQKAIDAGTLTDDVTATSLVIAGVVKNPRDGIKLLGRGELKAKANVKISAASASAKAAVEKAGGSVTILTEIEYRKERASLKSAKSGNVKPAVRKKATEAKVTKKATKKSS